MYYDAAPLEGITGWVWRQVHSRHFPGADHYYAPFVAPNHTRNFKTREREDLLPAHNAGLDLIPQILSNKADEFLWAAGEIRAMGYQEINLNLGCPVPMIARKKKGSGLLGDPEMLDRLLWGVFDGLEREGCGDLRISVKTRLGTEDYSRVEEIMGIYRRYPLCALIIHPRTQKDMYLRPTDPAMFGRALEALPEDGPSAPRICYNGDLKTAGDCRNMALRYPRIGGLMLGRGLLADPALIREARGGGPLTARELRAFHDDMLAAQRETLPGDAVTIGRMKELWLYMGTCFADADQGLKEIRKAGDMVRYRAAVRSVFTHGRFIRGEEA